MRKVRREQEEEEEEGDTCFPFDATKNDHFAKTGSGQT
jgi:hypothetical protein